MTETLNPDDVLGTLQSVMLSSDSDASRIAAAKILLERFVPKTDDEAQRRDAIEREHALTAARGLLAEFAALKRASLCPAGAMDYPSAPATTDAGG